MEVFMIRLLQFILAISILILLHEGGHFLFAKIFGVRVEKFYLFFDPWFHIFEFKPRGSDTTYGLGWLPLGGYCKISGMIDESFDTEQMRRPEQPWEFRSKPAWQRLLIMVGGVLVNFILALLIYSMILFAWGETYIPVGDMSMGFKFNETAKEMGFEDHDVLLGTDDKTFSRFDVDVFRSISEASEVRVLRGGREVAIPMGGGVSLLRMLRDQPMFARPFIPAEVDSVLPGTPAEGAGMLKGDRLLAFGGHDMDSWCEFDDRIGVLRDMMDCAKTGGDSLKARSVTVVFSHAATPERADTVDMVLSEDLTMGVARSTLADYYEPKRVEYGFLASFPAGARYGVDVLGGYVSDLRYVFSADGVKSLGGFGTIASLFPAAWDWLVFWQMTAFLSIILAFMNILPIPMLDGGHVLFLLYEIATRRKPSETFMVRAEYVGFAILIVLMVVANLNDILRWLGIM